MGIQCSEEIVFERQFFQGDETFIPGIMNVLNVVVAPVEDPGI
jgi:hypothetical protein